MSVRAVVTTFVLTLCIGSADAPAFAGRLAAPEAGFSLEIPDGWAQISRAEIAYFTEEMRRATGAHEIPTYDYAFQADARARSFAYP